MKIYYEKVFIKTEADLPKENGTYIICSTDGRLYEKEFKKNSPAFKKSWEQWIDWYFQPVEMALPLDVPSDGFTKNDIDFAYCAGIWNTGGIDVLSKELERLKQLRVKPYMIFNRHEAEIKKRNG